MNKTIYCSNCSRNGHIYNKCNEPVTSLGIIAFKINDNVDVDFTQFEQSKIVNIMSEKDKYVKSQADIKFLLVRRRYTLGYLEFIRGRYFLTQNNTIQILFQQMTKEEIYKISTETFDKIWFDVWVNNYKNYKNEFEISKTKYLELQSRSEYNLSYFCKNVVPKWECAEWGFPKGRRNLKEDHKLCALREFIEETGYAKKDVAILHKIKPIYETFHGTNGIQYKHIYYVSKILTNKNAVLKEENKNQYSEIGDINWFTYEEAIKLIRPYQMERLFILKKVHCYLQRMYAQYNGFFHSLGES